MSSASRWPWTLAALALFALVVDQATKYAVWKFTARGSEHVIIPGILNVVHTSNPGVAFGLLADSENPWRAPLLIVFSIGVICLIAWMLLSGRAGGRLGE